MKQNVHWWGSLLLIVAALPAHADMPALESATGQLKMDG